jgi:hypothetical protein
MTAAAAARAPVTTGRPHRKESQWKLEKRAMGDAAAAEELAWRVVEQHYKGSNAALRTRIRDAFLFGLQTDSPNPVRTTSGYNNFTRPVERAWSAGRRLRNDLLVPIDVERAFDIMEGKQP